MTWTARTVARDDAADAARFLRRLGYAVLAIGAPVGALLDPLALYILYPVGVSLIVIAAALEPSVIDARKWLAALRSPAVLALAALFAWAALSILWTPFRVEAWQQCLRYLGLFAAIACSLGLTRPHARATEISLFAGGVALTMATAFACWMAERRGATFSVNPVETAATVVAVLAFPAMGGLAAREHNGYVRALLVMTLAFCWLTGSTGVMLAFLAGFTVLSFAFNGSRRAAREMSYLAAAFIGLAPFFVLIAQPLLKLILHDKLQNQPAPFPSINYAFTTITRDGLRLITGHGFETIQHGVMVGALPSETPQVALFQLWYELGVVGAWLVAAIAFFAFREIGKASPRISPFLAAGLTTILVLGVAQNSLDDWVWLMALGLALAAADVGRRGEYRTKRPSADELARI